MSFKAIDDKLLKKYTQTWKKVRNLLNVKFDSQSVYGHNNKYIGTKIKKHDDNVNINFHGKKYQKKNLHVNVCHW